MLRTSGPRGVDHRLLVGIVHDVDETGREAHGPSRTVILSNASSQSTGDPVVRETGAETPDGVQPPRRTNHFGDRSKRRERDRRPQVAGLRRRSGFESSSRCRHRARDVAGAPDAASDASAVLTAAEMGKRSRSEVRLRSRSQRLISGRNDLVLRRSKGSSSLSSDRIGVVPVAARILEGTSAAGRSVHRALEVHRADAGAGSLRRVTGSAAGRSTLRSLTKRRLSVQFTQGVGTERRMIELDTGDPQHGCKAAATGERQ